MCQWRWPERGRRTRRNRTGSPTFLPPVPELFELWDLYCDAEGPVPQASALIEVSNHLFNMKTRWDQVGEDDD